MVGSFFKNKGYSVWTGDALSFAYYFQIARIETNVMPRFEGVVKALALRTPSEIADRLNSANLSDGWFVTEYAEKRQFFTKDNARRIYACMTLIRDWAQAGSLNKKEHAILLASLIDSIDRVANTAGTYYAYLKTWHEKALRPFHFRLLTHIVGNEDCHCFLGDAKRLLSQRAFDIVYLDPPYNERCYSRYYHLPEAIARDEVSEAHGKSGIMEGEKHVSDFNKHSKAMDALRETLRNASFRLLVFHYSDDGLINPSDIRGILGSRGEIDEYVIGGKGYTTRRGHRTVTHRLYLVSNE